MSRQQSIYSRNKPKVHLLRKYFSTNYAQGNALFGRSYRLEFGDFEGLDTRLGRFVLDGSRLAAPPPIEEQL